MIWWTFVLYSFPEESLSLIFQNFSWFLVLPFLEKHCQANFFSLFDFVSSTFHLIRLVLVNENVCNRFFKVIMMHGSALMIFTVWVSFLLQVLVFKQIGNSTWGIRCFLTPSTWSGQCDYFLRSISQIQYKSFTSSSAWHDKITTITELLWCFHIAVCLCPHIYWSFFIYTGDSWGKTITSDT